MWNIVSAKLGWVGKFELTISSNSFYHLHIFKKTAFKKIFKKTKWEYERVFHGNGERERDQLPNCFRFFSYKLHNKCTGLSLFLTMCIDWRTINMDKTQFLIEHKFFLFKSNLCVWETLFRKLALQFLRFPLRKNFVCVEWLSYQWCAVNEQNLITIALVAFVNRQF